MEDNLKSKAKKGLIWSFLERFSYQGVQFLFGIILARLLSPNDYGIIAMPLVFLAIAQCFIDSGFSSALVRKQDLKEDDLSTAFYFNIAVGVAFYILLFISSPWIAKFYNAPILADVLKFTALAVLFNPLCAVQQAILTRNLNFRKQALISFVAAIFSGVVGISLAYFGCGVWALVFQQVCGYFLRTLLLWLTSNWHPKRKWNKDSFHYLWGYGSKMLVSGLIDTIYSNIFPLVIGKAYSAKDLGNYTRAEHFAALPSSNITGVLQRVTFPVLSTIQDQDERLKRNYRKLLRLSAFFVFPLMLGLSAIADPLIRLILGDKWEGCILLLQIICFQLMWYPIHAINLNLLTVKGRSDLFLRLEIIKKIVGITILCFTIPRGVVWMVSGGVVSCMFSLIINTYYTGKLIDVGYFKQMGDTLPIFFVSFIMWGCIHYANSFVDTAVYQLLFGILIGIILYFCISYLFLRSVLNDAYSTIFQKKL